MDEFDNIVNNQPEDLPEDAGKLEHIWDAVEAMWPHYYDGMLIKGIMIAEYVDPEQGGRVLRFIASPDMTPWEMLGILASAKQDAQYLSQHATVLFEDDEGDDDGGK
jgi:hypothetical protein